MRKVYLDHAASTPISAHVLEGMTELYKVGFGNPYAIHSQGGISHAKIREARHFFAKYFSVKADHVIFTSGGTESDNMAILGIAYKHKTPGEIIVSAVEHSAVLNTAKSLEKKGWKIHLIPVNGNGVIILDKLEMMINGRTTLVSVMAVNNEVGAKQPLHEVGRMVKSKNRDTLFHVDAIQAFGKIPLSLRDCQADFMCLSGHKIHGPQGVGALIMADAVSIEPLFYGGGQEGGMRAGTPNAAGIYGFYLAAQKALENLESHTKRLQGLKEYFLKELDKRGLPVKIHSPKDGVPYIVMLSLPDVESEVLVRLLEQQGVFVSAGAACSSSAPKPNRILKEMGCSDAEALSAIRVSFSWTTEISELDLFFEAIEKCVKDIRSLKQKRRSPEFWPS